MSNRFSIRLLLRIVVESLPGLCEGGEHQSEQQAEQGLSGDRREGDPKRRLHHQGHLGDHFAGIQPRFREKREQRIVDTGSEFCRAHIFGNGIDGVEHPAIPREGG